MSIQNNLYLKERKKNFIFGPNRNDLTLECGSWFPQILCAKVAFLVKSFIVAGGHLFVPSCARTKIITEKSVLIAELFGQ